MLFKLATTMPQIKHRNFKALQQNQHLKMTKISEKTSMVIFWSNKKIYLY